MRKIVEPQVPIGLEHLRRFSLTHYQAAPAALLCNKSLSSISVEPQFTIYR
jgi:hypothetical protein